MSLDIGDIPISVGGGRAPVWSPDGSKIFYRSVEQGVKVVSLDIEGELEVGEPETILNDTFVVSSPGDPHYDVSRDGRSLLFIDEGAAADGASNQINVVLNWFQELERLPPRN